MQKEILKKCVDKLITITSSKESGEAFENPSIMYVIGMLETLMTMAPQGNPATTVGISNTPSGTAEVHVPHPNPANAIPINQGKVDILKRPEELGIGQPNPYDKSSSFPTRGLK